MSWTIEDSVGNTYAVDRLAMTDGELQFTRGESLSLSIQADLSENIFDTFGKHLTDNTIQTTVSYNGKMRFTETISANSNTSSYVVKLIPNNTISYIDDWWVLITEMSRNSRYPQTIEKLSVTVVPITKTADGDINYIQEEFEV